MSKFQRFADIVWRCTLYGTPCFLVVGFVQLVLGGLYHGGPGLVAMVFSPAFTLAHGVILAMVTLVWFRTYPVEEGWYRYTMAWTGLALYALAGIGCWAPLIPYMAKHPDLIIIFIYFMHIMASALAVAGGAVSLAVAERHLRLLKEYG